MRINKIEILNLDILYKTITTLQNNDDYKNLLFTNEFNQVLNQLVINLDLSDINKFEYIYLKRFSSDISKFNNNKIDKDYVSTNYWDIYNESIKPLLYLLNDIKNDNYDIDKLNILPLGLYSSDVKISLYGSALANIITYTPHIFFIKATKGKCIDENKKFIEDYNIYTEDLNSFIISEFIEKFYKYIIDSINTIDLPSSFFIDENFYNRNSNNLITLSSLYNREITFDFLNDNSTDINNKLKEYTNSSRESNLKDTRINFIVNSSLNSFVDLINLLPVDRIISYEPISIPINNCRNYEDIPFCPLEISDKYQVRYTERINSIIGSVVRYYSKDKDVIKKVSLVNGYSKYKYMISLKLSDIEEYLNIECKYELKEIIDIIKKYSNIFIGFLK